MAKKNRKSKRNPETVLLKTEQEDQLLLENGILGEIPEIAEKYRCAYCVNENQWNETYENPKDVQAHWKAVHMNPQNIKPFKYLVIEYAECFYCRETGTFYDLVQHHKKRHHQLKFVIIKQNDMRRCALCPFDGKDIVGHFELRHKLALKTVAARRRHILHIPKQLSHTELIRRIESSVQKKQKCDYCNTICETECDLRLHNIQNHRSQMNFDDIYDNYNIDLICNCCHIKIDKDSYFSHVEQIAFNFNCHQCDFQTEDLIELVKHDKMMHNLLNSFEYRCLQFKNRLKRDFLKTQVTFGNGFTLNLF
ncbi:uncharacterized protein LOC116349470 isoform X2 [Contarinia nasturtii]|uniref:uncharacterized protein LOC116349470 isoform X2 n=1 Tax=Contarinia nasturtii TaxID=265458 RepID=UPI0012D3860E|nr:uncharacterized protein LOC116349470 isoform X2 [Contarinia nasturtii]